MPGRVAALKVYTVHLYGLGAVESFGLYAANLPELAIEQAQEDWKQSKRNHRGWKLIKQRMAQSKGAGPKEPWWIAHHWNPEAEEDD